MKLVTVLALIFLAGGCEVLGIGGGCTLDERYAMHVTVVDSLTNAAVNELTTVIFTDGPFADTVKLSGGANGAARIAVLDHDRPGTYTVRVTSDGYVPWVATQIVVASDGCHAERVDMTARLRRSIN